MIDYLTKYYPLMIEMTLTHLFLVIVSLIYSLAISIVIIYLFINQKKNLKLLTTFFSTLYAVPSYAFFAILIPLSGLGTTTALIVLTLYSEYILLRTFSIGIEEISPMVVESAIGMGMTEHQVFFKIQLPLASKAVFSGIRQALTSLIGIATIAATINAGGIGTLLFDGLRTQSVVKILWGTILVLILCLITNSLLRLIEKMIIVSKRRS